MLEEKTVIDKIEILEGGQIQIRKATLILKDGVEIARTYHRHCLMPWDNLSQEDKRVQDHARLAWGTPSEIVPLVPEEEKKNLYQRIINFFKNLLGKG